MLQKRLAKYLILQCFRNSRLEDPHARISPSSARGDYSDVYVTSPYGSILWAEASRFNDDEMKDLMVDVVNRTYRFKRILFDEDTGPALLFQLAEHDPLPRWNQPMLPDNEELKARSKV